MSLMSRPGAVPGHHLVTVIRPRSRSTTLVTLTVALDSYTDQ